MDKKLKNFCKKYENDRIRHLNNVLSSIRDVNRLIFKEKDKNNLIKGVCESLVRNRGYYNAWIILIDDCGKITASAEAGLSSNLGIIKERIKKKDSAVFCSFGLKKESFVAIKDPMTKCVACPFSKNYGGRGAISSSLAYNGKIYGILTVSVPSVYGTDKEEHELFRDVANDIAFALHSIDAEDERKKTELALVEARDKLEKRVKERTKELEMLSSRLLTAQEEERKRIAGDLHDGIGQCLSAVKFMVETALEKMTGKVPDSDLKSLKALVPLLQETSEEVRTIVMNLRPSILDDLGVLATIGWFCRQFQAVYSYINLKEIIEIKENQVPDPLKTIIFRILQEAMNNISKHSEADRVTIYFGKKGDKIMLKIEDNGKGFDAGAVTYGLSGKGFGITGMKERTELSGGIFSISSGPRKGTGVYASWSYDSIKSIS